MGKDKEQRLEAPGIAFSRMNYLFQAAQIMAKLPENIPLSNYYNKILKEISKKVLEKLHPDLKRTMCCACNYPLTAGSSQVKVKIKPHKKKRKKKNLGTQKNEEQLKIKGNSNIASSWKYSKARIEARNKKPNKVWWSCTKCGYSRGFLQKPSKKLWIHSFEDCD